MFHVKHPIKKTPTWVRSEIDELSYKLNSYGLVLDRIQSQNLEDYACKIVEWNHRINLISTKDVERIVTKHIAESIVVVLKVKFSYGSSVLDLGSGAGFPGVPLKIVRPDLKLVLLDSKRMRTLFLREVVSNLDLSDTIVECQRAESLQKQSHYQGVFDFVLARAVTKLTSLWEWSQPLLKDSGRLIAFKGGNVVPEISDLAMTRNHIMVEVYELPAGISPYSKDRKLIIVTEKN